MPPVPGVERLRLGSQNSCSFPVIISPGYECCGAQEGLKDQAGREGCQYLLLFQEDFPFLRVVPSWLVGICSLLCGGGFMALAATNMSRSQNPFSGGK